MIVERLEHGRRYRNHHRRRRDVCQPHRQEARHTHEPERYPIHTAPAAAAAAASQSPPIRPHLLRCKTRGA